MRQELFYFLTILILPAKTDDGMDFEKNTEDITRVNKISDQVLALVEHYKQDDPIGLPGVNVPEPLKIPEVKLNFGCKLINLSVYGLSQFKIEGFNISLDTLQFICDISFKNVTIRSPFICHGFKKTIIVQIQDVRGTGNADMQVATNGDLEVREMIITEMDMNNNPTFEFDPPMTAVKMIVNVLKSNFIPKMKDWFISSINSEAAGAVPQINDFLKQVVKYTLPNSIAPIDLAVAEGRKYVRNSGFDPYKIEDYKHPIGVFSINVSNILVSGLSTFHRQGNLTLSMKNKTLELGMHASTKRLQGNCEWELSLGGFLSRYGSSSFSVEYLMLETQLRQPLDVRNKPKLGKLDIDIGNIQLRMKGIGTMDYLLEFVVNVLPNILRFQIVHVIESKLKNNIQELFDSKDIEKEIVNRLPELDGWINSNKTKFIQINPFEKSPYDNL